MRGEPSGFSVRSGPAQAGPSRGLRAGLRARVRSPAWLARAQVAILIAACPGCETLSYLGEAEPVAPAPKRLEAEHIALVTTRFQTPAPSYFSGEPEFSFEFYFDPSLVQYSRVDSYVLWGRGKIQSSWRRLATVPVGDLPLKHRFEEDAAYGLRASAIYRDGTEVCVPTISDEPLLWLGIDRTPPLLSWLEPRSGALLARGQRTDLRWGASDMEFGDRTMHVDWSGDGGETWYVIERLPARPGELSCAWTPPATVPPGCLLRVTATDLVGQRSEVINEVRFGPGLEVDTGPPDILSPPRAGDAVEGSPGAPPAGLDLSGTGTRTRLDPSGSTLAGADTPPGLAGDPTLGEPRPSAFRSSDPSPSPGRAPQERTARAEPRRVPGGPSITLLNFTEGRAQRGGSRKYIFFGVEGLDPDSTVVTAEWREEAGEPWQVVSRAPAGGARGRLVWTLPTRSSGRGELRLEASDATGRSARIDSPSVVPIDVDPPVAEIRGFRRMEAGELAVLLDCYDVGPSGLQEVILYTTEDGGRSWRERRVPDPERPVILPPARETLGLTVRAVDRVGLASSEPPAPGTPPARQIRPANKLALLLSPLDRRVYRGGQELPLTWSFEGRSEGTQELLLEISPNGVAGWELLGHAPLSSRRSLVILPPRDGAAFVIRATLRLPDGTFVASSTNRFAIDSSPPQLELGPVPPAAAATLEFPLRLTDPGEASLAGVVVHLRRSSGTPWDPAPEGLLELHDERALARVGRLAEGSWELHLQAFDSVGNTMPRPGESTPAHARFRVDKTPPGLQASATAFPWVEGVDASIQVELDHADAIPPLILEESEGDGQWVEVHRWASLPPGKDLFRFKVPVGRPSYTVRLSIRDRVGNLAYAVLGPRAIEPAVRMDSPAAGGTYVAGSHQSIRWTLHPALDESRDELRVSVGYRAVGEEGWIEICDGLAVDQTCVWTIPGDATKQVQLRLRLFRRGELVGLSESSEPIRVLPVATTRAEARSVDDSISAASLAASERADLQIQLFLERQQAYREYHESVTATLDRDTSGRVRPEALRNLPPETLRELSMREKQLSEIVEKIARNYQSALEIDARNYHASYGMARLIRWTQPTEVERIVHWLQRTLKIQPNHIDAINDLGAYYIQRRDYAVAEDLLRRGASTSSRATVRYNLALALFYQNKMRDCREELEALLGAETALSSRRAEAHYYLVASYLREGNAAEARRRFESCRAQLTPTLVRALETALERAGG